LGEAFASGDAMASEGAVRHKASTAEKTFADIALQRSELGSGVGWNPDIVS
jgi:hypothetical protein